MLIGHEQVITLSHSGQMACEGGSGPGLISINVKAKMRWRCDIVAWMMALTASFRAECSPHSSTSCSHMVSHSSNTIVIIIISLHKQQWNSSKQCWVLLAREMQSGTSCRWLLRNIESHQFNSNVLISLLLQSKAFYSSPGSDHHTGHSGRRNCLFMMGNTPADAWLGEGEEAGKNREWV